MKKQIELHTFKEPFIIEGLSWCATCSAEIEYDIEEYEIEYPHGMMGLGQKIYIIGYRIYNLTLNRSREAPIIEDDIPDQIKMFFLKKFNPLDYEDLLIEE